MGRWEKKGIVAVLTFVMLCTAVPERQLQAASNSRVKAVKVTNVAGKTLTLEKGKSKQLKVQVVSTGKGKVSQKVLFKSTNRKIVKVSSQGKVVALKEGSAKVAITAKADKKKKFTLKVKVTSKDASVEEQSTQPVVTGAPQSVQPAVTGASQSIQPTVTSAPQSIQPDVTGAPQSTQPDVTGASQSAQPVVTDVPQSAQPVLTEVPQSIQPVVTVTPQATQLASMDPQTSEPESTEPVATEEASTGDSITDPEETMGPAEETRYRYIETIDDPNLCIFNYEIRWRESYEVCMEAEDSWGNCKDHVSVIMNEDYADQYDFEIEYQDQNYNSYTDLEKGTKFIEVGKIKIYAKNDEQKTAVATYLLRFRRIYKPIETIEGGRILSCEIDVWERKIELYGFTDWNRNFGEEKSCFEDLIVQQTGEEYLYKMGYDAPKFTEPDEEAGYPYAGVLYMYDKEDVEKTNPIMAYEVYCDMIPELMYQTSDLSCVRLVAGYDLKRPVMCMYITEEINSSNVNDITSRLILWSKPDAINYQDNQPVWDASCLEGEYPFQRITGTMNLETKAQNCAPYCVYKLECIGNCYITQIQDDPLGVVSWEEDDVSVTVRASAEYVPDEEENSTLSRLEDSIVLADGYTAQVEFYSENYNQTIISYRIKIYRGEELLCVKTLSYEVEP